MFYYRAKLQAERLIERSGIHLRFLDRLSPVEGITLMITLGVLVILTLVLLALTRAAPRRSGSA